MKIVRNWVSISASARLSPDFCQNMETDTRYIRHNVDKRQPYGVYSTQDIQGSLTSNENYT